MRPLTKSLTREEAARLLDAPLELVDALLDSGRVLCHVRGGAVRIPASQLEAFFREALIRLYQTEGVTALEEGPAEEEERATEATLIESMIAEQPVRDVEFEPPPAGKIAFEEEEAGSSILEEQPPPAVVVPPMPRPPAVSGAPAVERLPDLRIASRYVPLRPISGIFGEVKFSILQLSETGLRIRHGDTLMPGDEAKLSFALMRPARSVVLRARVVWTSVARQGEERFSISGLRIIAHEERMADAIEKLKAVHELQPERRERLRRAADNVTALTDITDEEIALVTAAVQKFAADPVEASRWYSRARFALSDENVRRVAPERPRDREEVLGIWEFIDRQVAIEKIAGVLAWMKGGAAVERN